MVGGQLVERARVVAFLGVGILGVGAEQVASHLHPHGLPQGELVILPIARERVVQVVVNARQRCGSRNDAVEDFRGGVWMVHERGRPRQALHAFLFVLCLGIQLARPFLLARP